jgi:predicted nucleotidyltransferase
VINVPKALLDDVKKVFSEHVPNYEVIVFGSRVSGPVKQYSDLDIAIRGAKPVPIRVMAMLKTAFSESNLPFKVDVLDWHDISDSFRNVISHKCVTLMKPDKSGI